ncbi:MAG: hypothetical protein L3J15_05190 [Devosiaceae bacterium]|nr:hypothetical protein [Devosiaceae bacterium]
MAKNLWILTEERPKADIIGIIFQRFAEDYKSACFIDNIRILPVLNNDGIFTFTYEVKGLDSKIVDNVYLKIVSGNSSFVDFLIFYQEHQPSECDVPIYAIEETKTDDSESRNTGVFQRATKFVYIEYYYPKIKKIMLYNLQIKQKEAATDTNIFGTRCLLALGVEIMGKHQDSSIMKPFNSVDEIIEFKNSMRKPPKGNVPINLKKSEDKIQISGRLWKSGSLAHDPNIGALSLISATLRALGWNKKIEITLHELSQNQIKPKNKFIKIANRFEISLEGLNIPISTERKDYWHYEVNSEKLGTIFIHIVVENFSKGMSVYENHAGCERGYFITSKGEHLVVQKYIDKAAYKAGDKKQIIHIPDLVIIDFSRAKIINIEGKQYRTMLQGIKDLDNFDAFEKFYVKKHYPDYKIIRTVVLYGGTQTEIEKIEVSFLLNKNGDLIISCSAPEIFKESISNLKDYWHVN